MSRLWRTHRTGVGSITIVAVSRAMGFGAGPGGAHAPYARSTAPSGKETMNRSVPDVAIRYATADHIDQIAALPATVPPPSAAARWLLPDAVGRRSGPNALLAHVVRAAPGGGAPGRR